jgi:chitodextrinase
LAPIASCSVDPIIDGTVGIGGLTIFDGSGSAHQDPEYAGGLTYSWDFLDGNTASGVSTTHAFVNVGIFNVTLTVTDDGGLTNRTSCQVDVRDNDVPPNANIVITASAPICEGDVITLDGSTSTDLDNQIDLYEWDITAPVNFSSIDLTGAVASTSFGLAGNYDIGLRVTDTDGDNGGTDHTSTEFTSVTVLQADDPSCNQPPVANDDAFSGNEDTVISGNVVTGGPAPAGTDTDPDGDPLTVTLVSGPAVGFVLNADGSFAYTPPANFNGFETFTYFVNDGRENSNEADVLITVIPVNDDPVANAGADVSAYCSEGTGLGNVQLSGTATDVDDGDVLTFSWSSGAITASGPSPTLNLPWSPTPYTFTLTVTDGNGGIGTDTVAVTIVDNMAPAVSITPEVAAPAAYVADPGWNAGDVTVSFAAVDLGSGVASFTYELTGAQADSGPVAGPIVITAEGTTTVRVKAFDVAGNGPSEAVFVVNIDKTAPEMKNVFNPETLTVDVLALDDGSGVTLDPIVAVCVPTSWGSAKASAKSSSKGLNAELCTYTVTDLAGNTTVLVEKRKTTGSKGSSKNSSKGGGGGEVQIEVVSIQYNGGDVIAFPPKADKKFEWSLNSDGTLNELEQKMELGKGNTKQQVTAHYSSKKGTTEINVHGGDGKLIGDGLRLLCMTSNEGELEITFDPAGLTLKNSVKSSLKVESTKASKKVSEKASGKPSTKSSSKGKG